MSGLILRFLTRPGCHLCDDARPLVTAEGARSGVTIMELNIEEDDGLVTLYGLRIPVVLGPGDEIVAEGVINDEKSLRRAISELIAR